MVFSTAFKQYPELVIVAIINSGIGIYYYLKLLMTAMSKEDADSAKTLHPTALQNIVLFICAVGLLVGGFIGL
jgi:NADH:ubiquinone oxidoreductase subunit 2 (subunit N)